MNQKDIVVFVDVDDTLVRWVGTKSVPIPRVIERVRALHRAGATLYCWSTGGADYARRCTDGLAITDCFTAFLPKPHVIIDDQSPEDWKYCRIVSPLNVDSVDVDQE